MILFAPLFWRFSLEFSSPNSNDALDTPVYCVFILNRKLLISPIVILKKCEEFANLYCAVARSSVLMKRTWGTPKSIIYLNLILIKIILKGYFRSSCCCCCV